MVYCVAYNCAKKHTSNINDYIQRVSVVKTCVSAVKSQRIDLLQLILHN